MAFLNQAPTRNLILGSLAVVTAALLPLAAEARPLDPDCFLGDVMAALEATGSQARRAGGDPCDVGADGALTQAETEAERLMAGIIRTGAR